MRRHPVAAELLAEFAGFFLLIAIGSGVVTQVVAAGARDDTSIAIAWGFAVPLGVRIASRVSGAHLDPAVTLALAAFHSNVAVAAPVTGTDGRHDETTEARTHGRSLTDG